MVFFDIVLDRALDAFSVLTTLEKKKKSSVKRGTYPDEKQNSGRLVETMKLWVM